MNIYLIRALPEQISEWCYLQKVDPDYIVIAPSPDHAFKLAFQREYPEDEKPHYHITEIGTATNWEWGRVYAAHPVQRGYPKTP